MSEIVKCGICGKAFNKRYVNSHKRLAHDQKPSTCVSKLSEPEVMQEILSLYGRLSEDKRKELQTRLESRAPAR
jgi:hypothetical protein